ncbi:MAG: signal peptidase II [Sphingobium sp.]
MTARPAPKNHRTLGLGLAALTAILDQGIKYMVTVPLAMQSRGDEGLELLPIFKLRWLENYGVSMGFLHADTNSARWILVALTTAIALFVAIWMWRERARQDVIALGLVLGGAIGNIADRVRLGFVIDYADLHIGEWRPFLVFNLADAAITIGVLILLARALLLREKGSKTESHKHV